jgi:glycine hydroxymethyltransferase
MRETEMESIAGWIAEVLEAPSDEARIADVRARVSELCGAFPLYAELAAVG